MANPQPLPPKKRGCFFYGCITCLILLVVGIIGLWVAGHYAFKYANNMLFAYTDNIPMAMPKSNLSADETKQLNSRIATFSAALDAHTNTLPLILTGPEINALISNNPQARDFKNNLYVTLDGETIKGQLSLPLDNIEQLQLFHVKGRYLNGSGTFKAGITNGILFVNVQSLEVKGTPLPAKILAALQQQNLADGFNQGNNGAAFNRYESVEVKNDTLIIKPKRTEPVTP